MTHELDNIRRQRERSRDVTEPHRDRPNDRGLQVIVRRFRPTNGVDWLWAVTNGRERVQVFFRLRARTKAYIRRMGKAREADHGVELYRQLPAFAAQRRHELNGMFAPVLKVTEAYGCLAARAVVALGAAPPATPNDAALRDLIGDAFDFLYEWPRPLFEGRLHVAYPLARRAYESISLLAAGTQDPKLLTRWRQGAQIGHGALRAALSKLPMGEDQADLAKVYTYFSKGSHPNRELVSERYLGEGNDFVLGSIAKPDLILTLDQCAHLLSLWFWFGALTGWFAKEALAERDPRFGKDYLDAARNLRVAEEWVRTNLNRLIEELRSEPAP